MAKILRLHRYIMPGPPPVGGPKTMIVYIDDTGRERVKVVDRHIYRIEEARWEVV